MNNPSYSHQFISRRISLKQNLSLSSPKMSSASTVQAAGGGAVVNNASASNSLLSIQVGSPPKQAIMAREKSGTLNNSNNYNNSSMHTNGSQLEGIVTESDIGMHYITSNNQLFVNARHAAFLLDENSVIGSGGQSEPSHSIVNSSNPYSKEKRTNAVMIGTQPLAGIGSLPDKRHHWSSKSIQITQKMSNEIEDSDNGSSTQLLSRKFLDVPTLSSATSRSRYKIDALSIGLRNLPFSILESKNSLVEVDLSYNDFQTLPLDLCQFVHLRSIKMDNNRITSIPEEVAFLKHLEELSLAYNLLPSLPHTLQNMSQLRILNIASNRIAAFGSEITGLIRLERLYLQNNDFIRLPSKLYTMTNLKELGLDWFKFVRPSIRQVISFPDQGQIFMRLFELCFSKASGKTSFYGGNPNISSAKNLTGFVYFREFLLAFSDFPLELSAIAKQAADQEEIGVLRAIFEDEPSLMNQLDSQGQTVLTSALMNNQWRSVQVVIDLGADPSRGGGLLGSALHIAVSKLNVDLVEIFLDRGSNPNCVDFEGNSPLHLVMSIFSKDPQSAEMITELLLKQGANPNALNKEQWAPLHIAVRKNQRLSVQYALMWNSMKKEEEIYLDSNGNRSESINDSAGSGSQKDNQDAEEVKEGMSIQDRIKEDTTALQVEGDDTFPCMTQLKKLQSTVMNQKSFPYSQNAIPATMVSVSGALGSSSKANQVAAISDQISTYFDFDLQGGTNKWTILHIASSQGNIPMIEILSDANSSSFSLTRFSQTPRRVALQSLVLFKVLRKHESRWIDKNILSEISRGRQGGFPSCQEDGQKTKGFSHRLMNGYDERSINNLREFIAESMKLKEQFLQEQNSVESDSISFEEQIFGYSMKINLENNQAERPSNKEALKANYDDDEIEDPDVSEPTKQSGQIGSRVSEASGTLKPQQITTKISVKDMQSASESDQMSGIDEGFEDEQHYLKDILQEEGIKQKVVENISNSRATGFLGNSMMIMKHTNGYQGNLAQPSGQSVEDPDQHKEEEKDLQIEQEIEEGDLFNEISSFGFERCKIELDKLVERLLREEYPTTNSLGLVLLVRMMHVRMTTREMLFRSEKGTLPRNIHMFNEFLFSKLTAEEISKYIESIPTMLVKIIDTLISRIVPLPKLHDIPMIGSMTVYMQYNTIAIASRANARLWQLILSTRDVLLSLNQNSQFYNGYLIKCSEAFKQVRRASFGQDRTGILAVSGVSSPELPIQLWSSKEEEKKEVENKLNSESTAVSSSVMAFSTCDFSPATLVDFENWQLMMYNSSFEKYAVSPIGQCQVIGSPSFFYQQQKKQEQQRQIFELEKEQNQQKRRANKVALSAPSSNRESVERNEVNSIINSNKNIITSSHLQKRDLNCEVGNKSTKVELQEESKKIRSNNQNQNSGQNSSEHFREGTEKVVKNGGFQSKFGVDRISTNPEIRLPAPVVVSLSSRSVVNRREKLIVSITGEENITDDEEASTLLNTAADIVKSNSVSLYSARDTTSNNFFESQMLKSGDNNKNLSAQSSFKKSIEKKIEFSVFQKKA